LSLLAAHTQDAPETWRGDAGLLSYLPLKVNARARQELGGRVDSGRARAVESLTFRSLRYEPPPDEKWVVVGYRTDEDDQREVRIPWEIIEPGPGTPTDSRRQHAPGGLIR